MPALLALAVVLAGLSVNSPAAASEEKQSSSSTAAAESPSSHEDEEAETKRNRNRVKAALLVLGGIAMVGVAFIAMVLVWGARTRRIARSRGETAQHDPLWYLRKKPNALDDGGPPIADTPAIDDDNDSNRPAEPS